MAGSYYDLVRCRRITAEDAELLPRLQAAIATPGLEPAQLLRVHLAAGKAADDLGDYAAAMRHFDAADEVRRSCMAFDAAAFEREITRMIDRFTPALVARAAELGVSDSAPVLIIGMPRSGTTLVEQILSSHPEAAACGELNFWNECGAAWANKEHTADEAGFLVRAAKDYVATLRATAPGAARITDKMPFNFLWAGLIHLALPRATFIHCRRAALDTALSIHQTHFNPRLAFPTGGAELVTYIANYRRLTAHWRRVLPAERFIEVDYESLTASPETEIPRLVAAAGLPWHTDCLHPERNPRVVKTPSKWQARQKIYRHSVARWQHYEPFLGPLAALHLENAPG